MPNTSRIQPERLLELSAQRLLLIQAGIVAVTVAGMFFYLGRQAAEAACYGGGIALLNAWILGRRARMALETAKTAPGGEVMVLYLGVVQRFVFTGALFALGFIWLALSPLHLVIGFGLPQMGFFFGDGRKLKKPASGGES